MGFLEKIIVTPSHHRVHHAINKEYLDKNYGQIFIFWDKWFGTFQEELPDIKPVYGITRPVRTWNPIKINFMHIGLMIKDAWRTRNIKDKLRIWFMPTGWRPADVATLYPVYKIENVYQFEKYDTPANTAFNSWVWLQLTVLLLLLSYLFANIASISSPGIFIYGGFIFLYVYALTELMDHSRYAWVWELLKTAMGAGLLFYYGNWFGLNKYLPAGNTVMIVYLLLSVVGTLYFTFIKNYQKPLQVQS